MSLGPVAGGASSSSGWVEEFGASHRETPAEAWAGEFGASHRETPAEAWAGEFEAATATGRVDGERRCEADVGHRAGGAESLLEGRWFGFPEHPKLTN